MSVKTKRLRCALCNAKFTKKFAEITFQNKKWVEAGKELPKPFFCSRKCGQHYSGITYTECREIEQVAKTLRKREARKYRHLKRWLDKQGVKYRFEHPVGRYVFDLAIKHQGVKVLIEFDGAYHNEPKQQKVDVKKEKTAVSNGWILSRVPQPDNDTIPESYIRALVMGLTRFRRGD